MVTVDFFPVDVVKLLNNAPNKFQTKQPLRHDSPTCMKIGRYMNHGQTNKKSVLDSLPKVNRKLAMLIVNITFLLGFCYLQAFYCNSSSYRIVISTSFGQCKGNILKMFVTQSNMCFLSFAHQLGSPSDSTPICIDGVRESMSYLL